MKRLILLVMTAMCMSFSFAQKVSLYEVPSYVTDNVYIGVQGGAYMPLSFTQIFPLRPEFGITVGKSINPYLSLEINAGTWLSGGYRRDEYPMTMVEDHNFPFDIINHTSEFRGLDISLSGILNLNNVLSAVARSPWKFESDVVAGMGWSHDFGTYDGFAFSNRNKLIGITGFREGYNFGKSKEFQVYLQPEVKWNLTGYDEYESGVKMNSKHAYFGLEAGFIYKFKCSNNGTHNFKIYNIDLKGMNNEINSLRKALNAKPKVVKDTVTLTDSVKLQNIVNPYVICFAKNSCNLSSKAKKILNSIPKGSIVDLKGTASPEGKTAYNVKLSKKRVEAVQSYLKAKGIGTDSLDYAGAKDGKTSNRLVFITVVDPE